MIILPLIFLPTLEVIIFIKITVFSGLLFAQKAIEAITHRYSEHFKEEKRDMHLEVTSSGLFPIFHRNINVLLFVRNLNKTIAPL